MAAFPYDCMSCKWRHQYPFVNDKFISLLLLAKKNNLEIKCNLFFDF